MTDSPILQGRRVALRPLGVDDFAHWREVRHRNGDWLTGWEPLRPTGQADPAGDRKAFAARCASRQREHQLGTGYGFGIFVGETLVGEINLSNVIRGAFRNAHVGYWIDEAQAGNGYVPEALVVAARFAFEEVGLHRLQVSIVPGNGPSRRVVEKLDLRCEGLAERYLEINGVWEDHLRFAFTSEEWAERADELRMEWLD
ncbi:MAG: GNAT family N-acetyltransferase [Actinobacteria bacterium]|nr:GNAT family N-acetyltransferase [Actinomycetota bacterium]